jgi:release factor glutamine methyltransferase
MNTIIRNIVKQTYQPLLVKYLSASRQYRYGGLLLDVPPEVFHPGFFTSTGFLLRYLVLMDLKAQSLLDLGAGTGIIAIAAAKQQAIVTATDINPIAVQCIAANGQRNNVALRIYESDLFDAIPASTFDVIAINPPYYRKDPRSMKEHAWYCGANGEYFRKLFQQLPAFIHEGTQVLMTVCDGADSAMIHRMACESGFLLTCIRKRQHLMQKNFLYSITLC